MNSFCLWVHWGSMTLMFDAGHLCVPFDHFHLQTAGVHLQGHLGLRIKNTTRSLKNFVDFFVYFCKLFPPVRTMKVSLITEHHIQTLINFSSNFSGIFERFQVNFFLRMKVYKTLCLKVFAWNFENVLFYLNKLKVENLPEKTLFYQPK